MADQNPQNQGQNQDGTQAGSTPPWMDFTTPIPTGGQSGSTGGTQGDDSTLPTDDSTTETTPPWMDFAAPTIPDTPETPSADTPAWMQFTPDAQHIEDTPAIEETPAPTWDEPIQEPVSTIEEAITPDTQTYDETISPVEQTQPLPDADTPGWPETTEVPTEVESPQQAWEDTWSTPTHVETIAAQAIPAIEVVAQQPQAKPEILSTPSGQSASSLLAAFKNELTHELQEIDDESEMYETKIRAAKEEIKVLKQKKKDKMIEVQKTIKELEHLILMTDDDSKKKAA